MYLTIVKQSGETLLTTDYNIKVLKFNKGFPVVRHESETIESRDSFIDLGTFYERRKLSASCYFYGVDSSDTPLVQNNIFKLFDSKEPFYLIDSREPGKRWLVKCDSEFTMDQKIATFGTFEIEFSGVPYAESRGTTSDPKTFDAGVWQVGQGLTVDEADYTQTTTSFNIFNAGDILIDPRVNALDITFIGASTNLKITNTTTGDVWQYTGTTTSSDTIKLSGIRSTKNNVSIFGKTNRKLITLAVGNNSFQITGTSGTFTISFVFRFMYL